MRFGLYILSQSLCVCACPFRLLRMPTLNMTVLFVSLISQVPNRPRIIQTFVPYCWHGCHKVCTIYEYVTYIWMIDTSRGICEPELNSSEVGNICAVIVFVLWWLQRKYVEIVSQSKCAATKLRAFGTFWLLVVDFVWTQNKMQCALAYPYNEPNGGFIILIWLHKAFAYVHRDVQHICRSSSFD